MAKRPTLTRAAAKPIVSLRIARETDRWFRLLREAGAMLVSAKGEIKLDPQTATLIEAIHEVLGGGTVEIRVARAGDPKRKAALDAALRTAIQATNRLNRGRKGPEPLSI